MELVLVGLPGSGKTALGRRLAQRHGALFADLDEAIEAAAGRSVPDIFAAEGEAGFRGRERAAVAALGPPDARAELTRVIATGGGAPIDPRNRWLLYRGRVAVWLDGTPEALARRIRHSPNPRPLLQGRDPVAAIRALAVSRARFYGAAHRVGGATPAGSALDAVEKLLADSAAGSGVRSRGDASEAGGRRGTRLLDAETRIGRIVLGEGIAAGALAEALAGLGARRAILVSEPGAWAAAGSAIADGLAASGLPVERVMLPQGEGAKRLHVIETAARALAGLRVERTEPIVAIGGGALGDSAGFLAATYLRGIPIVHVPTTLVAQIDSSIGGKTAVDLPEGKNLVGAFHQPAAVIIDVALLRTLPERQRRSALGEAVKMAALGDERLLELLETDGPAIARGEDRVFANGSVAELVERAAWAKVEVVLDDEREAGGSRGVGGMAAAGRLALNLGHSLGHAVEAAGEYSTLLHGEAVAYGLRGACAIGLALGVTPAARAERIGALLDTLELGPGRLPFPVARVRDALANDKKHAGGRLRWILPTADGVAVRSDVPDAVVDGAMESLLVPSAAVSAPASEGSPR
jgi:shikimate kinase/3-dehydroquinate synthase